VAGAYRSEAVVVQAMCELYSRMMATMGMLMRPLLPQLLHELARTFPSTPVVGVLSTLRDAIEQYGRQQDDELHDTLLFVMSELVNFFCAWLSSTKEPEVRPMATDGDGSQRIATDGDGLRLIQCASPIEQAQPELLTAFWEMCHRCLVFQPGLLLSLPCAGALFDAAVACVRHQEFQHTRAVLTFICLFMCPTEAANPFRETSVMCIQVRVPLTAPPTAPLMVYKLGWSMNSDGI